MVPSHTRTCPPARADRATCEAHACTVGSAVEPHPPTPGSPRSRSSTRRARAPPPRAAPPATPQSAFIRANRSPRAAPARRRRSRSPHPQHQICIVLIHCAGGLRVHMYLRSRRWHGEGVTHTHTPLVGSLVAPRLSGLCFRLCQARGDKLAACTLEGWRGPPRRQPPKAPAASADLSRRIDTPSNGAGSTPSSEGARPPPSQTKGHTAPHQKAQRVS